MKKCSRCKEVKYFDSFTKCVSTATGYSFYCMECTHLLNKKRSDKNREFVIANRQYPKLPPNSILIKNIIGFERIEGYCISTNGDIFSCKKGKYKFEESWTLLINKKDTKGYLFFAFFDGPKRKSARIHQLVALAFIPLLEGKKEVNHLNGIRTDNRIENLEWCNRSENIKHAYDKLGHQRMRGMKSGRAKLTDERVLEIKKLLGLKIPLRTIADKFTVHHSIIDGIKHGKRWSHIIL